MFDGKPFVTGKDKLINNDDNNNNNKLLDTTLAIRYLKLRAVARACSRLAMGPRMLNLPPPRSTTAMCGTHSSAATRSTVPSVRLQHTFCLTSSCTLSLLILVSCLWAVSYFSLLSLLYLHPQLPLVHPTRPISRTMNRILVVFPIPQRPVVFTEYRPALNPGSTANITPDPSQPQTVLMRDVLVYVTDTCSMNPSDNSPHLVTWERGFVGRCTTSSKGEICHSCAMEPLPGSRGLRFIN